MRGLRSVGVLVAVAALAGTACSSGSSTVEWPAPSDPMARARAAGLVPEDAEQLQFHVHAHLDVFVNGQKVTVPAGIGIDTTNPAVHKYPDIGGAPGYGGIDPPCSTACISPLHTHAETGILHTESSTAEYNVLGQLFTEWNVKLDENCVNTYCEPQTNIAIYVNGKLFTGDPRTIPLSNFKEIAIVIGKPPARIPATGDFSTD